MSYFLILVIHFTLLIMTSILWHQNRSWHHKLTTAYTHLASHSSSHNICSKHSCISITNGIKTNSEVLVTCLVISLIRWNAQRALLVNLSHLSGDRPRSGLVTKFCFPKETKSSLCILTAFQPMISQSKSGIVHSLGNWYSDFRIWFPFPILTFYGFHPNM